MDSASHSFPKNNASPANPLWPLTFPHPKEREKMDLRASSAKPKKEEAPIQTTHLSPFPRKKEEEEEGRS